MIRKYFRMVPHWPQLPRRGFAENFVFQFLHFLLELGILEKTGERACFNTAHPAWPDRLTQFYSIYFAADEGEPDALARFASPRDAAPGLYTFLDSIERSGPGEIKYLKGHLVGPFTAGFQLMDELGRQAYYQEQLRDLIVKTLAMHARWQAATLSGLGRPALIFIDDPCISLCGSCYHVTLTRQMIIEDLNAIFSAVHSENAIGGVHSCNAADWSLLFEADLEIVAMDAYRFGESLVCYAAQMEQFLNRGGIMAWGIVPTTEKAFEEDAEALIKRLEALWRELTCCGVDGKKLLAQSMVTPACGAGLLSCELAEKIYRLTDEVSAGIQSLVYGKDQPVA